MGIKPEKDYKSDIEGYYALHIIIPQKLKVTTKIYETKEMIFLFEIQIRTQMQELIRKLLHNYYEQSRIKQEPKENWLWNYERDEFAASYLGHIIHYVDGKIVEIRNKQMSEL